MSFEVLSWAQRSYNSTTWETNAPMLPSRPVPLNSAPDVKVTLPQEQDWKRVLVVPERFEPTQNNNRLDSHRRRPQQVRRRLFQCCQYGFHSTGYWFLDWEMVSRKRQRLAVHQRVLARKQRQERSKQLRAVSMPSLTEPCPVLAFALGMTEGLDLFNAVRFCFHCWGYELCRALDQSGCGDNVDVRDGSTAPWYELWSAWPRERNRDGFWIKCMCLGASAPFEAVLDAAKVADLGLLLYEERRAIAETAETWLSGIRAQGLVSCIAIAVPPQLGSSDLMNDQQHMVVEPDDLESKPEVSAVAPKASNDLTALRPWIAQCNDRLAAASILDAKEEPVQLRCARSQTDMGLIHRQLVQGKRRSIRWRAHRPYMLVEQIQVETLSQSSACSVRLLGWLRGAATNAHRRVHVTGVGTFIVSRIERAQDEACGRFLNAPSKSGSMPMDGLEMQAVILDEAEDPSDADSMASGMDIEDAGLFDVGDEASDGETPWRYADPAVGAVSFGGAVGMSPTALESSSAGVPAPGFHQEEWTWTHQPHPDVGEHALPEGVSAALAFQSSLAANHQKRHSTGQLAGALTATGRSPSPKSDGTGTNPDAKQNGSASPQDDAAEETTFTVPAVSPSLLGSGASSSASDTEGHTVQASFQGERASAEDIHLNELIFPDEVDTPTDRPVRERFAQYRPLPSYRKTPWDAKASLPPAYARIVQFEHFRRAVRIAYQEAASAARMTVRPQSYLAMVLKGVPVALAQRMQHWTGPLVATSLLRHEHRPTVLQCLVQRWEPISNTTAVTVAPSSKQLVRSKQLFCFHIGFRRMLARPIFSEADSKCDKHRYERYLLPSRWSMASLYAPVTYPPAPVLVTRPLSRAPAQRLAPTSSQSPAGAMLVAAGSVVGANPERIVLKRIVLTGVPYRAHKNRATIRYMFLDPKDVKHYRHVPLWTKHGRLGRIEESLGTHGAMKATFDGTILHSDTVCLSLYKRIFPEWVSGYAGDVLEETGDPGTLTTD
jgi:hypothetical protein